MLFPFMKPKTASFSDLEVGINVMIWFDPEITDQKVVKQIVIITNNATPVSNS